MVGSEIRVQLTSWGEGSWNPHDLHGFSTIPNGASRLEISDPSNRKMFPNFFPTLLSHATENLENVKFKLRHLQPVWDP